MAIELHSRRMVSEGGEVFWVVFEQGQIAKPLAVMTDMEFRGFIQTAVNKIRQLDQKAKGE